MSIFQKKHKGSPAYFADILEPVENIPAGEPVTLGIFPEEHSLVFRWGKEDVIVVYTRIVSFIVDNEPRIRDGESRIDASLLENEDVIKLDGAAQLVSKVRSMSTKWLGELFYLDNEGNPVKLHFLERKRSGYYVDVVKSLQAMQMERYLSDELNI
ncbi:MAG: hypothetical protein LUC41_03305 [Clostridiales bacterium]|nr:hypothetical protein [Clostridiales bacterium]